MDAEEEAKARRGAIDAAIRAAAADRRKAEEQHEAVLKERAILEERFKALTQKECQALEAAEEARKEQVLLACARRDSSLAAAEMQRRHIEAAVQLEGPTPGGAVHATYEALKEDKVLRLSSETHHKEHPNRTTFENERTSPRRPLSNSTSTVPSFTTTVSTEPCLREMCDAVASEVESRLERWKEQLYMQEREGTAFPAPPIGEPSLAPPPAAADDNLKLFGSRHIGSSSKSAAVEYSESWPGIFSFPSN